MSLEFFLDLYPLLRKNYNQVFKFQSSFRRNVDWNIPLHFPHRIHFLRHLRDFFGIMFKMDSGISGKDEDDADTDELQTGGEKVMMTCVGIGYSNLSKTMVWVTSTIHFYLLSSASIINISITFTSQLNEQFQLTMNRLSNKRLRRLLIA